MPELTVPEQAINEIKAILERHDLAGLVIVSSLNDVAFLNKIDPTWSCAWMEESGPDGQVTVRIRSQIKEYGGDKERQKIEVEGTTGMFISFMNWADKTLGNMVSITTMLGQNFPEIMHSEHWRRGTW